MAAEQEKEESIQAEEEDPQGIEQEVEADYTDTEQPAEQTKNANSETNSQGGDRSNFVHGLAVGFGISCIATFVIVWISLFFTPKLQNAVTYENLLSIFVYPLIYLLSIGLIALTAGIVREYYGTKSKF